MSEIIENSSTDVVYCDFCGNETKHGSKCIICKRDMCMGMYDDGEKHAAYNLEIYRYQDSNRIVGHVCKECAAKKSDLTIGQLLDGMFGESPVPTIASPSKLDWPLELMVTLGFVTAEQVSEACATVKSGQSVMDALLEKKLITHAQIVTAKAAQFGAEVVNLKDMVIHPDVIAVVPGHIARKYKVVPIEKSSGVISIAIADPSDLNSIDSLTHLFNAEIRLYVASEEDIAAALDKYYPQV